MKKEYFYGIRTKRISAEELCDSINFNSSIRTAICSSYEGGGIYITTNSNSMGIKKEIERIYNIDLSNPIEV